MPHQQQQSSSMAAISQLFARLSQEIEEHKPKNCIHFIVDFLCKHYPEHLHGFASIWQMDPDLERERHEVVNFFKAHKISTAVAAHFANAGYDTLDTLTSLTPDSLVDVEAFNNVKWLPGHKVRLQQIFGEIQARVRGIQARQRTTERKLRIIAAAISIQRIARGRALRARLWAQVSEQKATAIAAAARGFLVRKRRLSLLDNAIRIQRQYRKWLRLAPIEREIQRKRVHARKEKAAMIQRLFRQWIENKEVKRILNAEIAVQQARLAAGAA